MGIFFIIQVIRGILLSFYYSSFLSFFRVQYILYETQTGWVLHGLHRTIPRAIFFSLYFHILKGLFVSGYRNKGLWGRGVLLFVFMIAESFLGYSLVGSQISYWAIVVIIGLLRVIPIIGVYVTLFLWGGYVVGNNTLMFFFRLHFLIPFLMIVLVLVHLYFLHNKGRSSPLGYIGGSGKISFVPYFLIKDSYNIIIVLVFLFMVYGLSYLFVEPDLFVEANPLVRPAHIVPEWYLLPFYGVLRSIPSKIWGVFLIFSLIVDFYLLSIIEGDLKPTLLNLGQIFSCFLFVLFFLLGWVGCQLPEWPYRDLGFLLVIFYFSIFFFFSFSIFKMGMFLYLYFRSVLLKFVLNLKVYKLIFTWMVVII